MAARLGPPAGLLLFLIPAPAEAEDQREPNASPPEPEVGLAVAGLGAPKGEEVGLAERDGVVLGEGDWMDRTDVK